MTARWTSWAAIALLALGATACGESGSSDGEGDEFVVLTAPEGWAAADSGLKVAEDESDLRTDEPDGPVITVEIGVAINTDFVGMANEAFADLAAVEYGVLDGLTIDGFDASGIAIRADGRVVQYLAVHPPDTEGAVVVLDAPADRYEELREVAGDAIEITP